MSQSERILDISWGTILKIAIAVAGFYILYSVQQILVWVVFALVISILFTPAVTFLHKKKIPRILAVVAIYVGIFGILSLTIYLIIPLFFSEIRQFLESFPEYLQKISPLLRALGFHAFDQTQDSLKSIQNALPQMGENIFDGLFAFFGGVFSTLFVISMAVFLSLEERAVEKALVLLFPKRYESMVFTIWERVERKVSGWFGVRVLVSAFVGVASYITFLIFQVKYPFALGLFVGLMNFIPYLGPLLSGILLFVAVFPTNVFKAIFVVVAFILIQQIDNNILSPILMKRFVGLPPALVLVSLVVGGKLWGFLGAVLVIPLAGILFEFLKEFLEKRRARETAAA